jgi:metal-responsive CopG/Arc/MetJ family transcriptional regulator
MKISISVPDSIFEAAEELAKRLGMSRSRLYSNALEAFVLRHQRAKITERLNEIYKNERSDLDSIAAALQSASLSPNEEWI